MLSLTTQGQFQYINCIDFEPMQNTFAKLLTEFFQRTLPLMPIAECTHTNQPHGIWALPPIFPHRHRRTVARFDRLNWTKGYYSPPTRFSGLSLQTALFNLHLAHSTYTLGYTYGIGSGYFLNQCSTYLYFYISAKISRRVQLYCHYNHNV